MENRLDKYRNNDGEKYAINHTNLWNIIIEAIERIPKRFQYIFSKFAVITWDIFLVNFKLIDQL